MLVLCPAWLAFTRLPRAVHADCAGNATLTNMTSTQPELGGDFQTAALSVEEFTPGKAHRPLHPSSAGQP